MAIFEDVVRTQTKHVQTTVTQIIVSAVYDKYVEIANESESKK